MNQLKFKASEKLPIILEENLWNNASNSQRLKPKHCDFWSTMPENLPEHCSVVVDRKLHKVECGPVVEASYSTKGEWGFNGYFLSN